MREHPRASAKTIATLKVNTKLELMSTVHKDGWYIVKTVATKKLGWVQGNDIRLADATAPRGKVRDFSRVYEDEWLEFEESVSGNENYNPAKMSRAGNIVTTWKKVTDKKTAKTVSIILYQVNCSMPQVRSLAGVEYYSDGRVSRSWDNPSRWSIIFPDTVIEVLRERVCKETGPGIK